MLLWLSRWGNYDKALDFTKIFTALMIEQRGG